MFKTCHMVFRRFPLLAGFAGTLVIAFGQTGGLHPVSGFADPSNSARDFRYLDVPITLEQPFLKSRPVMIQTMVDANALKFPLGSKERHQLSLAVELGGWGDHVAAIEILSDIASRKPKTRPYVMSIRGVELMDVHLWDSAEADLAEAARLFPHSADNFYNYALALIHSGKTERAAQASRMSAALGFGSRANAVTAIADELLRQSFKRRATDH